MKDILEELKRRPHRSSAVGSLPKLEQSVKEVIVQPECGNNVDAVVDNILATTIPKDLLHEKTTEVLVQSRIQDTATVEGEDNSIGQRQEINMDGNNAVASKVVTSEGISTRTEDAGPSTSIPSPTFYDFEEMLRRIPNSDGLKELLALSVQWP